jgi:hypothetical protein
METSSYSLELQLISADVNNAVKTMDKTGCFIGLGLIWG